MGLSFPRSNTHSRYCDAGISWALGRVAANDALRDGPRFFLDGFGDFHQVEVRVAHIDRTQLGHRAGLRYRAFDDLDSRFLEFPDYVIQWHRRDEAKIERPRHRHMRARLELLS